MQSTITRRVALTGTAAGAAVLLAGSVGAAAAAVTRPKRRPSGAWYVREFEKIHAYPRCAFYINGKEPEMWFRLGTYPDLGLRGDNCHDRYDELAEMVRRDPSGYDKIVRHCYKTGRGRWWAS